MIDVNKDGLPDIVGFGEDGIWVGLNTGSSIAAPTLWSDHFGAASSAGGWNVDYHPRRFVDVNNDGRPDVVGFANAGVIVALNTGKGFGAPKNWVQDYGHNQGWMIGRHPRYLVDVNGDKKVDVVGFGHGGISVSLNKGSSFGTPTMWSHSFGYGTSAGQWGVAWHPRTLTDYELHLY